MRELAIDYGNCRQAKTWVNKTIRYTDLKNRLRTHYPHHGIAEEYARMSKAQRDAAKDHGGFVAGVFAGGRRKVETVDLRSMITLDGDCISKELLQNFETRTPYTSCLYSTHNHTPDNPRARLLFPLTRDVTPEEFVAVSRFLAQELGCERLVNPRLIEAYAQAFARYIQCEEASCAYGLLGKHPTTGGAFVQMSQQYQKSANLLWYEIYDVVK